MSGPYVVPRLEDAPDGVRWAPFDDPSAVVLAYRPGHAVEAEYPITLRLGRNPSKVFLLDREEARRLADALTQASDVAGGAA